MTLYRALKMYGMDADEITVNFPTSFPMESGNYGFSGCTFATIAEEAPEAFTLKVSDIRITEDDELIIWTMYGKGYRADIGELFRGDLEDSLRPDVWTAIRWLGWDLKTEDEFTIGNLKKIADICRCDLDEVLNEIREEK